MEMRSYDIVIPGAGVAGTAAARVIEGYNQEHPDAPFTYIILEAADRPGGRIKTEILEISGRSIASNEGPEWIHTDVRPGAAPNPQLEMAKSYGLHPVLDNMPRDFYKAGQRLNYGANTALANTARAKIDTFSGTKDISLAELFAGFADKNAQALITTFGESETGAALHEVSVREMQSLVSRNMGAFLREGMGAFFERFAEPVKDHIELNAAVTEIHWQTGEVHLADGEVIQAGRTIPTMSVGVLKSGDVSFVPEMPETHGDALSHIRMADLNKVELVFDENFRIPFNHNTHLDIRTANEEDIFALARLNAEPLVKVYMGGALAKLCDTDPEEAARIAVRGISEVVGEHITPHLALNPRVVQWGNDPYVLGAYSLAEVGHADVREILAEPFGVVHLAGEAIGAVNLETGQNYATHVAGAMFSGERAARAAILALEQEREQRQESTLTIAGSTSVSLRLK